MALQVPACRVHGFEILVEVTGLVAFRQRGNKESTILEHILGIAYYIESTFIIFNPDLNGFTAFPHLLVFNIFSGLIAKQAAQVVGIINSGRQMKLAFHGGPRSIITLEYRCNEWQYRESLLTIHEVVAVHRQHSYIIGLVGWLGEQILQVIKQLHDIGLVPGKQPLVDWNVVYLSSLTYRFRSEFVVLHYSQMFIRFRISSFSLMLLKHTSFNRRLYRSRMSESWCRCSFCLICFSVIKLWLMLFNVARKKVGDVLCSIISGIFDSRARSKTDER